MRIFYIICFLISIFILLNLALFIHNKFREGFVCKNKPVGFSLNPTDKKNEKYLSMTFGKPENDPTPLLDGDGVQLVNNGIPLTIGTVLGSNGTFEGQYSCNDLIDYTEADPKWRKDDYTIDNNKKYPLEFQKAISTGCKKKICDSLTSDNNIINFGMNEKQQQDIYGINEILKKNHLPVTSSSGFSNVWRLNEGKFSVHGEDITAGNKWQPGEIEDTSFFSQTSDSILGFNGIIDGKDKLLAWTNDGLDSKLFTCNKPCNGKENTWKYDEKTITSGKNNNINYYHIKDMSSDETFNWMIHSYNKKNYIEKKLNNGDDYLNHEDSEYKNYFSFDSSLDSPFEGNNKFIEPKRGNIYWKTINIDRRSNQNYNPVQITNNNKYVIILSHSDDSDKNGIYICKKPCTGEIYNWHKILNDRGQDITLIRGDFSSNILWYIKDWKLFKLTLPDNVDTEQKMFSDGYVKKNISLNSQPFIINTKGGFQIKLVYGGDKQYLWVIFVDDTNIYGIDRDSQEISKTIITEGDTTNFIVEESVKNTVQQQKCSDGFSSEGKAGVKKSCKTLTNNESSTVKNNYCDQPSCKNSDFTQCCTFNQTCKQKQEVSSNFCNIDGMSGFKDDLNNLYCEGPECQKSESGKPHKDVFVCCKPNNLPTKAGVCNAVKEKKIGGKYGGMTYDFVNPTDGYSGKYSTRIASGIIDHWEKSKYLNLMDYATKEWKKKPSGGKFRREGFELNNIGKGLLKKVKEQNIKNELESNSIIESLPFINGILTGENILYDNLPDGFKLSKNCKEWDTYLGTNQNKICPGNLPIKDTVAFYDGLDNKILSDTSSLKNFCCGSCGAGKWDDNDICTNCTVVDNAATGASYTCSNANNSRLSACKNNYFKVVGDTSDASDTCNRCNTIVNAPSDATYTCSNANNSRLVGNCKDDYFKVVGDTSDICQKKKDCGKQKDNSSRETGGTTTTDRSCVPCAHGTFATSDSGTCAEWTKCPAGKYQTNTPTSKVDRNCETCTLQDNCAVATANTCSTTTGITTKKPCKSVTNAGYYLDGDKVAECATVPDAYKRTCDGAGATGIQTVTCNVGFVESGSKNNDLGCTAAAADTSSGFRNMEGFSGFTRNDWTKGQKYMKDEGDLNGVDSDVTTFLTNLKTAKNHDVLNIPCTKNFSDGGFSDATLWEYQNNGDKYCPPFQPTCEFTTIGSELSTTGICTGNLPPPELKKTDDKISLRNLYSDKNLTDSSYCTGVFSTCGDGGFCTLNNTSINPWSDTLTDKYGDIVINANTANQPQVHKKVGRTSIDPKCKPMCGWGERCIDIDGGGVCVTETSNYASGSDNVNSVTFFKDGIPLLSTEELRIRGLTADEKDKHELRENNAKFLEEGSLKKWNLTKGGSKDSEIKSNNFRKTIDLLKTKYIWYFNIPPSVINALFRLPELYKINLGLKNFLLKTRNTEDFKKAIDEDKEITISYNKRAIVTALYKLSKKKQTKVGEKNWSKIINDEWVQKRSFKTADSCSGGVCSGDLTLTDLDTTQKPWGYKSRKAFKKKAPGTSDNLKKLGDTNDVGKHLYGNTRVRNIFDTVNPHPHQNDFIFLNKKN
jgi:hypothetical protein